MDFERNGDKVRMYTSITYPFCELEMISNGLERIGNVFWAVLL